MKKVLCSALLATALGGCAQVAQLVAANPQVSAGAAIAVEGRTGIECASRTQAGDTHVSDKQLRLQYERIAFDMALSPLLGGSAMSGVQAARKLTDTLCPALPLPPAEPSPPD